MIGYPDATNDGDICVVKKFILNMPMARLDRPLWFQNSTCRGPSMQEIMLPGTLTGDFSSHIKKVNRQNEWKFMSTTKSSNNLDFKTQCQK